MTINGEKGADFSMRHRERERERESWTRGRDGKRRTGGRGERREERSVLVLK
jgi:hypothetical protein